MKLYNLCQGYFNGFNDLAHFRKNNLKTNLATAIKILSYFTVIIPLVFSGLHKVASLVKRAQKKEFNSALDSLVSNLAQYKLSPAALEAQKAFYHPKSAVKTTGSKYDFVKLPKWSLRDVLGAYSPYYAPTQNQANLREYSQSTDFKRHKLTARSYYNASQLSEEDALQVVFQREPTNIEMKPNQYNKEKLGAEFGYTKGVFNDPKLKKSDGSSFKDLPHSVSIYSETYLWNPPGQKNKIEIACLSVPAPALDVVTQPHHAYYVRHGILDANKYQQEMRFLFKSIETALRDNKDTAFEGKGIQRLVLSRFGQNNFLKSLSSSQKQKAYNAFKTELAAFLKNVEDTGVKVVMSEYSQPEEVWLDDMIIGDIAKTAKPFDLIINAWDPNSAPGNGNDNDPSFDGAMGKSTGILLTQTSWLNESLRHEDSLVAVES